MMILAGVDGPAQAGGEVARGPGLCRSGVCRCCRQALMVTSCCATLATQACCEHAGANSRRQLSCTEHIPGTQLFDLVTLRQVCLLFRACAVERVSTACLAHLAHCVPSGPLPSWPADFSHLFRGNKLKQSCKHAAATVFSTAHISNMSLSVLLLPGHGRPSDNYNLDSGLRGSRLGKGII